MIETAVILTMIVLLAMGSEGGWSSGFVCTVQAGILLAIPLGLRALFGDVGGWIGTGLLGLLALAAVVQGVARMVAWWRGDDEGAVGEADHF